MYIVTRKGDRPSIYSDLHSAVLAAALITDPACWIWRLETSRSGRLKRIEVSKEAIENTQLDGIWCIQNRSKDKLNSVDDQLSLPPDNRPDQVTENQRQDYKWQPNRSSRFIREASETMTITHPEVAGRYFQRYIYVPSETLDQEEMWALLLDARNRVQREVMLYRGTVKEIVVRPSEVLKEAVRLNLPGLILAHNHPSGVSEPSLDDIAMTQRINEAARLLDIEFLDHLIIVKDGWSSVKRFGHQ